MGVSGADIAADLQSAGQPLPEGHALHTLEDRPDLHSTMESFGSSVWPEFMLNDAVADAHWQRMAADFPGYQLALLDGGGEIVSVARSAPLAWDGSPDDLPPGWDAQLSRSVAELERGLVPNTLGAIMIVTDPARRGDRLGGLTVTALKACAGLHGLGALVACVRPTLLEHYPLTSIEEYAAWTRDDGLPFDPWIRLHVRLGGRLSRPEPGSMLISGSVAAWEEWTGMAFPVSGPYVVPGACAVVEVDRASGMATYRDPNVWIIHDLGD